MSFHTVKLRDFYQTSPGDNIAPSQATEVFPGYDSKFLYVAFHCFDDPSKVRANIAKRDDIFNDDYVGMLLDTFNDHRKAYELDFNPLGIINNEFDSWMPIDRADSGCMSQERHISGLEGISAERISRGRYFNEK